MTTVSLIQITAKLVNTSTKTEPTALIYKITDESIQFTLHVE